MQKSRMDERILSALMAKYKKSKVFKEGGSKRRVMIKRGEKCDLFSSHDDINIKEEFNSAVRYLSSLGLITYTTIDKSKDSLISAIYLNTDKDKIKEASTLLGITPPDENLDNLICDIEETLNILDKSAPFFQFLNECLVNIKENRHFPQKYFSEDNRADNKDLLKTLVAIEAISEDEILEYLFSLRTFGDTKYFKEKVRANLLKLLRAIYSSSDRDDDELLELCHIVRTPEVIKFKGNIKFILDDGSSLDFSSFSYGAVIDSLSISHITSCSLSVSKIITYENYTNYLHAIKHGDKDTLYIFHGGWESKVKRLFFEKIALAIDKESVYHWGDIDAGGFGIFLELKRSFKTLKPLNMDRSTLEKYKDKALPLDDVYIERLKKLRKESDYSPFFDVLDYMIDNRIWLEMENLIL